MELDRKILSRMGIAYPRPYQELILARICECLEEGKRCGILGCLPTGSGKSLCFMYPAAACGRRTLIIYPLLALMNDQAARFGRAGIPYTVLSGGLGREERRRRLAEIRDDPARAVITNPEMLLIMKERGEMRELGDIALMVIDEAHTAVTWGGSFRPSYQSLPALIDAARPQIVMAFTATMDRRIRKGIVESIFGGTMPYIVHASPDRENIFYHSRRCISKENEIIAILTPTESRPAVIFCRSRPLAERLARRLGTVFSIKHYHAGLEREEKKSIERWFMASRDGVLAATSAFGMGVSKDDIRTVIHHTLPSDASEYLQESGRAGRDGGQCDAWVLLTASDTGPLVPLFRGEECIRHGLMQAMDETPERLRCLGCSHCLPSPSAPAGEREILRYAMLHPFQRIQDAAAALTSPHPFSRSRLASWKEQEAIAAIRLLGMEGRIRIIRGRILAIPKDAD